MINKYRTRGLKFTKTETGRTIECRCQRNRILFNNMMYTHQLYAYHKQLEKQKKAAQHKYMYWKQGSLNL